MKEAPPAEESRRCQLPGHQQSDGGHFGLDFADGATENEMRVLQCRCHVGGFKLRTSNQYSLVMREKKHGGRQTIAHQYLSIAFLSCLPIVVRGADQDRTARCSGDSKRGAPVAPDAGGATLQRRQALLPLGTPRDQSLRLCNLWCQRITRPRSRASGHGYRLYIESQPRLTGQADDIHSPIRHVHPTTRCAEEAAFGCRHFPFAPLRAPSPRVTIDLPQSKLAQASSALAAKVRSTSTAQGHWSQTAKNRSVR